MIDKTLIFFIDGASWDLLEPWISDGELPVIKNIRESSAWGNLKSVIPTTTNIALPSFYFGKDPSRLQIFYLSDSDAFFINSETLGGHKYFWEILSEHGYKSLISDLPFTYPIRPFGGALFSGFFTPSGCRDYGYPGDLPLKYPDYPRGGLEFVNQVYRDKNTILEEEILITQKRFDAFFGELKNKEFDVACFYVGATDLISHFLWDKKSELLKFYKFLDGLLGELADLQYFNNIILASDHGFSQSPSYEFYVNAWLEKEGFLAWKKGRLSLDFKIKEFLKNNRKLSKLFYQTKYWALYLFSKRKNTAETSLKKEEKTKKINVAGTIDIAKSRAYAVGGILRGRGIRINKELVKTEKERDELISILKNKLSELRYNGLPAAQLIEDSRRVYSLRDAENFPDIIFLSKEDFFVEDRFGKNIFCPRKTKSRATGHHMSSINGIFAWSGKNIKSGRCGDVSLLDIIPTLLNFYGCPLPSDLSGGVIKEIFTEIPEIKIENKKEELLDEIDF